MTQIWIKAHSSRQPAVPPYHFTRFATLVLRLNRRSKDPTEGFRNISHNFPNQKKILNAWRQVIYTSQLQLNVYLHMNSNITESHVFVWVSWISGRQEGTSPLRYVQMRYLSLTRTWTSTNPLWIRTSFNMSQPADYLDSTHIALIRCWTSWIFYKTETRLLTLGCVVCVRYLPL
jgi:hypothetical protein